METMYFANGKFGEWAFIEKNTESIKLQWALLKITFVNTQYN